MTAQLAGVFSLVSSHVSVLGESVSKTIASAGASTTGGDDNRGRSISHSNGIAGGGGGPLIAPETIDAYKQTVATGWSNLATGAVGLWSKSLEVVQAITKPPDEDDVSVLV